MPSERRAASSAAVSKVWLKPCTYSSTSRMPVAGPSRSPTFGAVSIASRRQSSKPIEASEKRPSPGAVSFARATLIRAARSVPNHGLARAPFTGLRVVAISSVGLVASAASSRRAPVPASDAQPSSANADAADPSTRSMLRRDTAAFGIIILTARAPWSAPTLVAVRAWLKPDRGNSRAVVRPRREDLCLGDGTLFQRYHAQSWLDAVANRTTQLPPDLPRRDESLNANFWGSVGVGGWERGVWGGVVWWVVGVGVWWGVVGGRGV